MSLQQLHRKIKMKEHRLLTYVRPLALIFLTLFVCAICLLDGNFTYSSNIDNVKTINTFNIKNEYIDLFKLLLIAVYGFFFTGRSFEKVHAIKYKEGQDNA
jgi:hypothetical protein